MRLGIFSIALSMIVGLAAPSPAQAPDFASEVWPIFEARCVKCHGEKKQKGALRLDSRAAIEAGGDNGAIFVSGDSAASSLHNLVILPADDPDIMPASGDPLTPEQIAVVKAWIDGGAEFGDWTEAAAAAPAAPAPGVPYEPTQEEILAKLAEGVAPAPEEALAKIRETGALALPLDQNTPLLRVDFNLQGDAITDKHLALLAPIADQLTWLNLAKTQVTDGGLAAIAGLPKLTRLHLEQTGISDPALAHLTGLANLQYLNLYGTAVTDAGMDSIAGLPTLKKLYLWQTEVTPEGATKLAAAIPGLETNLGEQLAPDPAPEEEKAAEEMKEEAPAEAAPAEEAAAPEVAFDEGSCCAVAKADGKDCEHPCCVEARAAGKVCEKCNPGAAAANAPKDEAAAFDEGSCCALAKADGKDCEHPCCVEARAAGTVCEKCNPGAVAKAPKDEAAPQVTLFDEGSCCATAKADGKDCEHPCCTEARTAGKVCEKCNPNTKAQQEA